MACVRAIMTWGSLSSGGAERSTIGLADALAHADCDVTTVVSAQSREVLGALEREISSASPVIYCDSDHAVYTDVMASLINSRAVDVIYSCRRNAELDCKVARAHSIPVFLIAREIPAATASLAVDCYRQASHVIAISNAIRDRLVDLGVPPGKVTTVLNGIDVDDAPTAIVYLGPTVFTFAYIGRLVRWKKVDRFVRAAARLDNQWPDRFRFIIIGDGPEKQGLQDLSADLGVSIDFSGWTTPIWKTAALFHALVLTTDEEPFGRVLVESMLMGRPVIAPDAGGPIDIVRPGVDGILYNPHDIDSLANSMLTLGQNKSLYEHMARAVPERGREFSAATMAARVLRLTLGVLGGELCSI